MRSFIFALLACLCLSFVPAQKALSLSFVVNDNYGDEDTSLSTCTLHEAVHAVNALISSYKGCNDPNPTFGSHSITFDQSYFFNNGSNITLLAPLHIRRSVFIGLSFSWITLINHALPQSLITVHPTAPDVTFLRVFFHRFYLPSTSLPEQGGCIFASGSGTLTLEKSIFEGCPAQEGGAIYVEDRSVHIIDTAFARNEAKYASNQAAHPVDFAGGAIYAKNANLRIEKSEFRENRAIFHATPTTYHGAMGGALYLKNAQVTNPLRHHIENSTFSKNRSLIGGAIVLDGAIAMSYSNTLYGNEGEYSSDHILVAPQGYPHNFLNPGPAYGKLYLFNTIAVTDQNSRTCNGNQCTHGPCTCKAFEADYIGPTAQSTADWIEFGGKNFIQGLPYTPAMPNALLQSTYTNNPQNLNLSSSTTFLGGHTHGHALLFGSSAIDAGVCQAPPPPSAPLPFGLPNLLHDQVAPAFFTVNGYQYQTNRISGQGCDIGAIEVQNPLALPENDPSSTENPESPSSLSRALLMYPNPAMSHFALRLPKAFDEADFHIQTTLYTLSGRKVYSVKAEPYQAPNKVTLPSIAPGHYLVVVKSDHGHVWSGRLQIRP